MAISIWLALHPSRSASGIAPAGAHVVVSSQAPACDTRRLGFFHSAEATAGPADIIAMWSHDLIATTLSKINSIATSWKGCRLYTAGHEAPPAVSNLNGASSQRECRTRQRFRVYAPAVS